MAVPRNPLRIPTAAHPDRRRGPLRWHRPKSSSDDEEAPAKGERPQQREIEARVARAERILAKSRYCEVAREFGRLAGEAGDGPGDCRVVVPTGGGPGVVEAANRGAHDVEARTVGLDIDLPHEQYPNPNVTPDLCFRFHYSGLHKRAFLRRAKALVAFPGGLGTLDELFWYGEGVWEGILSWYESSGRPLPGSR